MYVSPLGPLGRNMTLPRTHQWADLGIFLFHMKINKSEKFGEGAAAKNGTSC